MSEQTERQVKSRQRVTDHGEVFTNQREVCAMLDLVKEESERIDSRFLEPACGDGNFLSEILRRKLAVCEQRARNKVYTQLQYEQDAILAISSIYGIELLSDNVIACRERLLDIFTNQYTSLYGNDCKAECTESAAYLLSKNIIHGNALTYHLADNDECWIVVCEWSMIGHGMVNRRDYDFKNMVDRSVFADQPVATFDPVYFLNLNAQAYGE